MVAVMTRVLDKGAQFTHVCIQAACDAVFQLEETHDRATKLLHWSYGATHDRSRGSLSHVNYHIQVRYGILTEVEYGQPNYLKGWIDRYLSRCDRRIVESTQRGP